MCTRIGIGDRPQLATARQSEAAWRFSTADCTVRIATSLTRVPSPSTFSFNSPIGACETCRGFGRSIGVDYGLVIPDSALTLREGRCRQALANRVL